MGFNCLNELNNLVINQVMSSVVLPFLQFLLSFRNGQFSLTRDRQAPCFLRLWDVILPHSQTYTVYDTKSIIINTAGSLSSTFHVAYSNYQMTTGSKELFFCPPTKNRNKELLNLLSRFDTTNVELTMFSYLNYEQKQPFTKYCIC